MLFNDDNHPFQMRLLGTSQMQQTTANKNEGINHCEAIFAYATLGIVVTDGKGKIFFVNPFALREFGYTEKELIDKQVEKYWFLNASKKNMLLIIKFLLKSPKPA